LTRLWALLRFTCRYVSVSNWGLASIEAWPPRTMNIIPCCADLPEPCIQKRHLLFFRSYSLTWPARTLQTRTLQEPITSSMIRYKPGAKTRQATSGVRLSR
jgi:hypothetical protein